MAVNPANMVIGGLTVSITRPTAWAGAGIAVDVGGIDAGSGCSITASAETYSPDIEQELFASIFKYMKKAFKLAFTYAEIDLANLRNALDIPNAIATTGVSPNVVKGLSFGTALAIDFQPAPLVIAVTGICPGATPVTNLRTWNFNKAFADSPGEMKITKKGIATQPATYNGAFDATTSKVGTISDAVGT